MYSVMPVNQYTELWATIAMFIAFLVLIILAGARYPLRLFRILLIVGIAGTTFGLVHHVYLDNEPSVPSVAFGIAGAGVIFLLIVALCFQSSGKGWFSMILSKFFVR
jgi:hypothetical protein